MPVLFWEKTKSLQEFNAQVLYPKEQTNWKFNTTGNMDSPVFIEGFNMLQYYTKMTKA